jgi:Rad3-related DNA helicase
MDVTNWVCNVTPFEIQFAPIWVRDKCQSILFKNSKKVILTSASVNYKTAEMLGIKENDCLTDEYPHTFPVETRMIYLIQGGRMNAKADGETLIEWLKSADSIIRNRLDRKGIFHTTAYHRREYVITHSQFLHYMMTHNRNDVVETVGKFRESAPPKVLVSPSVTTGWDFPYEECEYQILGKVPYPDTRNVITKARNDADKEYAPYIAMQQIIQACGRGCRATDDHCENFIIDDNINWFLKRYRKFAPKWFLESITSRIFPPEPPPSIKQLRMGRKV